MGAKTEAWDRLDAPAKKKFEKLLEQPVRNV
jgi:hypothetical protein